MSEEEETITPKYIVFDTEDAGLSRAATEGQARNYSYYRVGSGTRYYTSPIPCEDGTWALEVTDYISLAEDETTVTEVVLLTEE
jgi:hypothetical protein